MPKDNPQAYTQAKGGKLTDPLRDMNQDGQRNFADTFLGDLLGFDGQMGLQGRPGMMASLSGARRGAIQLLQQQGAPLTEQNVQRAMEVVTSNTRPQSRPQMQGPPEMEGPSMPPEMDLDGDGIPDSTQNTPGDVNAPTPPNGAPLVALPGAVVGGAAAAAANRGGPVGPTNGALNGEITDDDPRLRGSAVGMPNNGATVTINPVDTSNMVGGPAAPRQITSNGPNAVAPTQAPQLPAQTPRGIPIQRPEDEDLSGQVRDYIDQTTGPRESRSNPAARNPAGGEAPLPEGVVRAPEVGNPAVESRIVDTGQRGPNGELIFTDATNGGYVAQDPRDGGYIRGATFEALTSALRAIR